MKNQDVKIDLGAVQETLILPLWARAKEMERKNPIVHDTYARDIVARIDYDFSKIEAGQVADHQIVWAIRAYNFDSIVKTFLAHNSSALVVNIGAGLDTTFQRVDNGSVLWVNIDLPDVAALRQKLIPDSEREMTIAKSVFDFTWINDISQRTKGRSILFMAAGVLCYFEAQQIEILFRKLAEAYPSAHVIFDSFSWFTAWGTNSEIMKDSGMDSSALIKWHLKRASRLRRWVDTIQVIEEYPMLSRLPARNDLSRRMIWGLRITGLFRLYNMVHVQL
jgi:O-methyltransferase involved in polyketide biosynthesis